jgi:hypothetical protein
MRQRALQRTLGLRLANRIQLAGRGRVTDIHRIRPTMTTVPSLVMLVGPVIQAIGEPSPYVRVAATAKSSRADLAQLQAPIGHRQPTQNDIPPSVREVCRLATFLGWHELDRMEFGERLNPFRRSSPN